MNTITIKYFGEIAEATKCNEEQIVFNNFLLSDVVEQLYKKHSLHEFDLIVALNHKMVDTTQAIKLKHNDEVAILPPFAGG